MCFIYTAENGKKVNSIVGQRLLHTVVCNILVDGYHHTISHPLAISFQTTKPQSSSQSVSVDSLN